MDATDNAESDEFARLLAQLNGTAAPEPEVAAPGAPAMPAPAVPEPAMPAPVMPAPAMPAPAMPAPAMPAPAMPAQAQPPAAPQPQGPAQVPVAPAFGVAAPFPPRVDQQATPSFDAPPSGPAPLTFPTFTAPSADLAPATPPLPRAPELMGADELAAPPRPVPTLSGPVPTLVSPPLADDQAVPAAVPPQPLYAPPQPISAPPPNEFASAPAPSAPALFAPESSAPVGPPAAAPATPAGTAPATPAGTAPATPAGSAPPPTGRAPMDFSSLLVTPSAADGEPSPAGAPTFGSLSDEDDDEPDIGRSTTGEKVGLALAVLVAPIGLLVGIVAAARSAQRRGWVVGIVRASIAIAAVLTVAIGIGGYYGYTQLKLQQAHDQIAASSAAFCSTIKANPSMDQLPTFGWPAVGASIPESLKTMQAYEDRWTKLAKASPAGIKPGVSRVAAAAKKIIDAVTVSRTVDDASNVALMSSVASSSGVPGWYSEYCG